MGIKKRGVGYGMGKWVKICMRGFDLGWEILGILD